MVGWPARRVSLLVAVLMRLDEERVRDLAA